MDASKLHMRSVISQKSKPIVFYNRKLNSAQVNYSIKERELLSIADILKEFRNILLGKQIKVYTDHKILTYKTFNTERVMRWRFWKKIIQNSYTYKALKISQLMYSVD